MYGKIFPDIFDSTLMADGGGDAVYIFMSLIVLKDQDGAVRIDGRVLSKRLDLPQDRFDRAMAVLLAPDPDSNLPDMQGMRVVPLSEVDFPQGNRGYFVVNHEYYREKGGAVDKREQGAKRQQKWRDRSVTNNAAVTPRNATSVHTDTDTDTDKEKRRQGASNRRTSARFEEFWKRYPVKKEKRGAREVWKSRGLDGKADEIMQAVDTFQISDSQWLQGYIPHPTTFLRGERWEDEIKTATPASKDLWGLSDDKLMALAEKRGVSTGGKSKKELINELG